MDSLERWNALPISMIGCINIINMSILHKFLYLCQSIPLPLPATFFMTLKKMFIRFIWNNNRPRLRLSLLYLPYERGGLKVPNIKLYYWAAQLCSAMYYFIEIDPPACIDIEKNGITIPLQMYIYSYSVKILKKIYT